MTVANLTKISETTVGSGGTSSITFDVSSVTYDHLYLVMNGRVTSGAIIQVSFNSDTTAGNYEGAYLEWAGSGTVGGFDDQDRFIAIVPSSGARSGTFGGAQAWIFDYRNTTKYKTWIATMSDGITYTHAATNYWKSASAITTMTLTPTGGGNFVEHTKASLYGLLSRSQDTEKASGGIVSEDATYYYHAFPFTGTFQPTQNITADVLSIAGGGAGGGAYGGGGGAGGLVFTSSQSFSSASSYTVTVGAGGASAGIPSGGGGTAGTGQGGSGTNSNVTGGALSLTAAVGGGGGGRYFDSGSINTTRNGVDGGCGGGGGAGTSVDGTGGTGSQGNNGGQGRSYGDDSINSYRGGGGGGMGAVGGDAGANVGEGFGGRGGAGVNTYASWANATGTGELGYFAGGGAGGTSGVDGSSIWHPDGGIGGGAKSTTNDTAGGGGNGGLPATGGGGAGASSGGAGALSAGGNGGSGIVIIRYTKV